jgi:hypothetical protein
MGGTIAIQRRGRVLTVKLPRGTNQTVSLLGVNGAVATQAGSERMAGIYELSVGDLAPGMYLLRIGSRTETGGMTMPVSLVR